MIDVPELSLFAYLIGLFLSEIAHLTRDDTVINFMSSKANLRNLTRQPLYV